MKKHACWILWLLCALLSCHGAVADEPMDAASLGLPSDSRWTIECDAAIEVGFTGSLNEYRVHQVLGSDMVDRLNERLAGALHERISMQVGELDRSRMYSGNMACAVLLDHFNGRPLSEEQEKLLGACLVCLEEAGWHPHDVPYAGGALLEWFQRKCAMTMGRLDTCEEYLQRVAPQGSMPDGDMQLLVLAADIDGYPVVPSLFGDFADTDVPYYAELLMNGDEVLYLDVGCSYVIDQSIPLQGEPITGEEALRTALCHAYQQWQQAWAAMAGERDEVFDYPSFWQAYDPHFILRVVDVWPCYYAREGILRPCWQVDCRIDVLLSNDENLSDEERHRYVPARMDVSYDVDAYRGEIIW